MHTYLYSSQKPRSNGIALSILLVQFEDRNREWCKEREGRTDTGSVKHRQRALGSNVGHGAERAVRGPRLSPHTD